MRRALLLALLLLIVDQLTKHLASIYLLYEWIEPLPGFGLTFITNPGTWINPNLAPAWFPVLQGLALVTIILYAFFLRFYRRFYRASLWIELSFACLLAAALGNLFFDKLLYGEIRDFLITPIAIANLADIYGNCVLAFLAVEWVRNPPARSLFFSVSPVQRWRREAAFFYRFALACLKGRIRFLD
jgi:lipoprotein signal peptidase